MPTADSWWFVKSRRPTSNDDYETWIAGGVSPTLNAFDNANENRATVVTVGGDVTHALTASQKGATEDGTGRGTPIIAFNSKRHAQDTREDLAPTLRAMNEVDGNANGGGQVAIAYSVVPEGGQGADLRATQVSTAPAITPTAESRKTDRGVRVVVSPTLSASNDPSRSPQSSEVTAQVEAMVQATATVRRLTPKECERLQGFPDDWTAERYDFKKGEVVAQADSARYKQMGNAIAVPVFAWVLRRLVGVNSTLPD